MCHATIKGFCPSWGLVQQGALSSLGLLANTWLGPVKWKPIVVLCPARHFCPSRVYLLAFDQYCPTSDFCPIWGFVQPVASARHVVCSTQGRLPNKRFCAARGFCPTRDIYLICCYVQPGASAPWSFMFIIALFSFVQPIMGLCSANASAWHRALSNQGLLFNTVLSPTKGFCSMLDFHI